MFPKGGGGAGVSVKCGIRRPWVGVMGARGGGVLTIDEYVAHAIVIYHWHRAATMLGWDGGCYVMPDLRRLGWVWQR